MTVPIAPRGPLMLTPPEMNNRLSRPGGLAEDCRPPLWAWKMRWSQRFREQVPIVVMGDSIEFGSNQASVPEYTWVGRLGYILRGDRHYSQLRGGIHILTAHGGWTSSGTITRPASGVYDLGLQTTQIANTAYLEISRTCTGFEIYFTNGAGASGFTISIDGTPTVTITPSTTGGLVPDGSYYTGPLTRGSHTIRLTANGANTFIHSIYAVDDDNGIGVRVYNAAKTETTAQSFANQSGFSANMSRLGQLKPALVINVVPSSYKGYLNEMIVWIKMNTGPYTSILLLHKYRRLDIGSPTYPITEYQKAMREVATATPDCDFLDISPHFPATRQGDYLPLIDTADMVHPSAAGHSLIADLVADHLLRPLSNRSAPLGTPATITTTAPSALSGVLAAWRGSDLGTAGTQISSWATYAGTNTQAATQATGTNQPSVGSDSTINGRKFATFTNVGTTSTLGTYLQTAAWASKADVPMTIAVVYRRARNRGHVFSGRTSGAYVTLYAPPDGATEMLTNAAAGSLTTPSPAAFWAGQYAWGVYCLVVNGTSSKILQASRGEQDFTMSTVAQNAAAGLQGVTIGARYDGQNAFSGDIAELIIWNRALTDTEAQGVCDYWARDYGLDRGNRTSAAA
jgi:hypothetical protein